MSETAVSLVSRSEAETYLAAQRFSRVLQGGRIVSISGELGAGKTTFVRGLARALGISEPITSPTFVLQKIYEVPDGHRIRRVAHYDLYRINSYAELVDIGFEDIESDTVVFAEWGEKFELEFPTPPIRISLQYLSDTEREITIRFRDAEEAQHFTGE